MGIRFSTIGVLLLGALAVQVRAATIPVTNTNDSGPGSLRQVLANANNGDRINFAVTGTITLTSGGLLVTKNVAILGSGNDQLSIDGNQALFVLAIFPDKTAAIFRITIGNGQLGIYNDQGTLTVSNCIVTGNSVGGLYNDRGALTVSSCVVSGNSEYGLVNNGFYFPPPTDRTLGASLTIDNSIVSGNSGPGVSNTGNVTIVNSTLSGNSAGSAFYGGGISSGTFKAPGSVTVSNSTISGNSAPQGGGGGISNQYGFLSIVNSSISGNSAGDVGGGISNYAGGVQIANSTISGNSAGSGGGIYNVAGQYGATIETGNAIFDAGASGENIFDGGTVTSHGYNLSSDDGNGLLNGPGDQINIDPLLGPLEDDGGPTFTHMLLTGSPAIDAGDPNFTQPPFRDQRGPCFHRVFGHRIDIGSVETQPQPRCPTPRPRPTPPR